MSDLDYLVALRRFNRSWRVRRWLNPPRVALWAIRRHWPTKVTPVDLGSWGVHEGSRGFFADRRDFRRAVKQRSPRLVWRVTVCWLRGHDMPWTDCLRCEAFIP